MRLRFHGDFGQDKTHCRAWSLIEALANVVLGAYGLLCRVWLFGQVLD